MTFHREEQRTSRKQRLCDGCQKTIAAGSEYQYCCGKDEHGLWSTTHHSECLHWERFLNDVNKLQGEDYTLLYQHVDNDKMCLEGAPVVVCERFGLHPFSR